MLLLRPEQIKREPHALKKEVVKYNDILSISHPSIYSSTIKKKKFAKLKAS